MSADIWVAKTVLLVGGSWAVTKALEWQRQRLDFADALHVASRGPAETFISFDEGLVRRTQRVGAGIVRLA